jgi:RNA polymerase sigma factor (sigma-70 family)
MLSKAVTYDLLWDPAACEAVEESQRWIIAAMHRHGHELVTMLWRILGNEQDVCDAYQTTFLHLAHHDEGRKPRRLKAYLFRTASNAAISMLRRRMAEKRVLSNMSPAAEAADNLAKDFDVRHLTENLRDCLAELPTHLRDVVLLRDLGELSYREVARSLGISVGTARVYRCKAIQLLAAWMKTEEER